MEGLRTLTRYELALAGLVVLGVALRVLMVHRWPVVYDGATMGWSLLQHGEFLVPYAAESTYYRHYPPLHPAYLAAWYGAFGFSATVTQAASLALALLFLLVVYGAMADLFGRSRALYATVFVALEPMMVLTFPAPYAHVAGLGGLKGILRPGDVVGVSGMTPDMILPYVDVEGVNVVPYRSGFEGRFLITTHRTLYDGFVVLGEYVRDDLFGERYVCWVLMRA